MADAKRPAPVPQAECEEGQVVVELPAGEWLLSAVCRMDEQTEGGGAKPQPELDEEERNSAVSSSRPMVTCIDSGSYSEKPHKMMGIAPKRRTLVNDDIRYHTKLREAMSIALSKENLELVCADLGPGVEFVKNGALEWECQRVIDECKRSGRRKMELLLYLLRSQRPRRTFPDLPPDEDPWWIDGEPLSI